MKQSKGYKIYYPDRDQYSSGGMYGSSSKKGKMWYGIGNLNKHLGYDTRNHHPENAEIHEFDITITPVSITPLTDHIEKKGQINE